MRAWPGELCLASHASGAPGLEGGEAHWHTRHEGYQARRQAGRRVLEPVTVPWDCEHRSKVWQVKITAEKIGLFPDALFLLLEYPSTSQLSKTKKTTATEHSQR